MDTSRLVDGALRRAFEGRPVLMAMAIVRAGKRWAERLRAAGVTRVCILGLAEGGDPPDQAEVPWHLVPADHHPDAPAHERLAELPAALAATLDAFDPHRRAVVLTDEQTALRTVEGRTTLGCVQNPAHLALEYKGTADAWFDRVGIPRLPAEVHPLDHPGLLAVSRRLSRGDGAVWAGVDRDPAKPRGGARLVRRVRDAAEAEAARAHLRTFPHVREVRITPFVHGVPFGVNAWVFPDGVAVGPLVEMVIFREGATFRHHGMSTFWRPPRPVAAAIREGVRRLGQILSSELGYRGAFTFDGVLTPEGPVPTELNARAGGGASLLEGSVPELTPTLLSRVLRAGVDPGFPAAVWEAALMAGTSVPRGQGQLVVDQPWEGDRSWPAVWTGQGFRWGEPGEPADLTVWAHAMQPRGFLRLEPDPARTPLGPALGPRILAALRLAAGRFDLPLAQLPAWEVAR